MKAQLTAPEDARAIGSHVRVATRRESGSWYRSAVALVAVRPVTKDNWEDFVRLMEAKGSPHHCWCTTYRVPSSPRLTKAQKKSCMRSLVAAGTPIGVLAYAKTEPVGWCSIAPRETYVRLNRSRTMPRAAPPTTPTWTLLCFFVARPYRARGVAQALLDGAVTYVKEQGGQIIEGYPFDTAGLSSTHRGHSQLFKAARFQLEGTRWFRLL